MNSLEDMVKLFSNGDIHGAQILAEKIYKVTSTSFRELASSETVRINYKKNQTYNMKICN